MKDFDALRDQRVRERKARYEEEGRDRSFLLGGEVFEYRLVFPFSAADAIFSITPDTGVQFITDRMKSALPEIIEPGEKGEALERLRRVMANSEIEYADLRDTVYWIMEEQAERPTLAPTSSGDGRETTGESSTESSSSAPAEPVASVS